MTYLDLAARGRNALWRYLVTLPLGFLATIVVGSLALIILMALKIAPPDLKSQLQHATDAPAFFIGNGLIFGILLASYWAAIRLLHHKTFADLVGAWRWRAWLLGAGVWAIALAAASLADYLIAPRTFSLSLDPRTPMLIAVAVPALAVQTFTEEFLFRGYLTQGLYLLTKRPAVTAVLSGLLFGSAHIPNGWPQAAGAVVFGVAMALIAIRARSLAFGCGLHLVNNLYGAVVVVSGGDVFRGAPGIFTQVAPQLTAWDTAAAAVLPAVVAALVLTGRIDVGADRAAMVA